MQQTWKPTVAGILSILSGAVAVILGLASMLRGEVVGRILMAWRWEVFGLFALVVGIIAITGGIFALNRRVWGPGAGGDYLRSFPTSCGAAGHPGYYFCGLIQKRV